MSISEDRLRAALHVEAERLNVSDDDLRRMEEDLMTLLDSPAREQRRPSSGRTRWTLAAVAAVAAVLALAGVALWRTGQESAAPVPASPPSTSAILFDPALVGLWRNGLDGEWLWTFTSDGRLQWVDTAQGMIHGGRQMLPVTARDGDTYDVIRQPGNCRIRLQISATQPDSAVVRIIDDQCPDANDPGSRIELDRVSGRGASSPALEPTYPSGTSTPVTAGTDLAGTWLDPATGTLLAFDAPSWAQGKAEYVLDDDGDALVAPDQRGTVTVTPSGAVGPVAGASTVGTCAPVFTKVVSDRATLTTTAGPGGCFPQGSTTTWIALN